MNRRLLSCAVATLILFGTACERAAGPSAPARSAKPPSDEAELAAAPRISVSDAARAVRDGRAVLLDVRSDLDYGHGHAEGAQHIPVQDIDRRFAELPPDKEIITYCT